MINSVMLTKRREQDETAPFEEEAIYTTIIPTTAEVHTITILPGTTAGPLASVSVQVDKRNAELIVGSLDQLARSDGIAQVIAKALNEAAQAGQRFPSIAVRGGPSTPWADVVAAVMAAMRANGITNDGYNSVLREGRVSPKTIILAPMVKPIDPKP